MSTAPTSNYIYVSSDNLVQFKGAVNALTGAYLNAAVVACNLYDSGGALVPGASGITMTYQPGTNGNYAGVIPSTVALVDGAQYTVEIVFAQNDVDRTIRWDVLAVYSGPND